MIDYAKMLDRQLNAKEEWHFQFEHLVKTAEFFFDAYCKERKKVLLLAMMVRILAAMIILQSAIFIAWMLH